MFDKMVFAAIKQQMGSTVPLAKHLGIVLDEVAAGLRNRDVTRRETQHESHRLAARGCPLRARRYGAGAAVAGAFGQKILQLRVVVSEATVKYTKAARGAIVADAHVVGDPKALAKTVDEVGKVVMQVDVALRNAENVPVAEMTFHWHVSKPQKN